MLLVKSWKKYWRKLNFIIVIVLAFFFINHFFTIASVEIIGTKSIIGIDYLENKNILLLSTADIRKYIYSHNPLIKEINLKKIYPHKLVIWVKLEKAIAELLVEEGVYDLTSQGKLIKKSRNRDASLIPINMYQKYEYNQYNIGEVFKNADLQLCLFFINKFKDLGLSLDSVDISVSDMIILKDGDMSYTVSTGRDRWLQSEDLRRIIVRSRISGLKYKSIDLRFDKPVIRF